MSGPSIHHSRIFFRSRADKGEGGGDNSRILQAKKHTPAESRPPKVCHDHSLLHFYDGLPL